MIYDPGTRTSADLGINVVPMSSGYDDILHLEITMSRSLIFAN